VFDGQFIKHFYLQGSNMHWANGFGGGWMMIFWWMLILAIGYGLFQFFNARRNINANDQENALDILKKRYARGEITKSEFEQKKEELKD
jgi:putative membrane protein